MINNIDQKNEQQNIVSQDQIRDNNKKYITKIKKHFKQYKFDNNIYIESNYMIVSKL